MIKYTTELVSKLITEKQYLDRAHPGAAAAGTAGNANPYLQSVYAAAAQAANPYAALQANGGTGLLGMPGAVTANAAAAGTPAALSTGNPLMDVYANQSYMAQLAAAGIYPSQAGQTISGMDGTQTVAAATGNASIYCSSKRLYIPL